MKIYSYFFFAFVYSSVVIRCAKRKTYETIVTHSRYIKRTNSITHLWRLNMETICFVAALLLMIVCFTLEKLLNVNIGY